MDFWQPKGPTHEDGGVPVAQVMLHPRSLLLYTGDAYALRHGIRDEPIDVVTERCANAAAAGVTEGQAVKRGNVRLSVVFVQKGAR